MGREEVALGPTGGGRVEKWASPPPLSPCALVAGLPTSLTGRPACGWKGEGEDVTIDPKGGNGIGVPQPRRRRRLRLHLPDRQDEATAVQIRQLRGGLPVYTTGGGQGRGQRRRRSRRQQGQWWVTAGWWPSLGIGGWACFGWGRTGVGRRTEGGRRAGRTGGCGGGGSGRNRSRSRRRHQPPFLSLPPRPRGRRSRRLPFSRVGHRPSIGRPPSRLAPAVGGAIVSPSPASAIAGRRRPSIGRCRPPSLSPASCPRVRPTRRRSNRVVREERRRRDGKKRE